MRSEGEVEGCGQGHGFSSGVRDYEGNDHASTLFVVGLVVRYPNVSPEPE